MHNNTDKKREQTEDATHKPGLLVWRDVHQKLLGQQRGQVENNQPWTHGPSEWWTLEWSAAGRHIRTYQLPRSPWCQQMSHQHRPSNRPTAIIHRLKVKVKSPIVNSNRPITIYTQRGA